METAESERAARVEVPVGQLTAMLDQMDKALANISNEIDDLTSRLATVCTPSYPTAEMLTSPSEAIEEAEVTRRLRMQVQRLDAHGEMLRALRYRIDL